MTESPARPAEPAPEPVTESVPQAADPAGTEPAPAAPEQSQAVVEPVPAEPPHAPEGGTTAATPSAPTEAPPKARRPRKAPAEPKEKKVSALDEAARVLAEAGQPMSCQEMIGAMAAKGYWTSPGGKTPQATLYSAILREITTKGAASRFTKAGPGKFALANPTA